MLRKLLVILALALPARADFIDLYANPNDMPQNKGPRVGKSRVVVIPVQIDYGLYQPVDMDRLHAFFEGKAGDDALTFTKYFGIASNGRYAAIATVAPLVHYTGCPSMIHTDGCSIPRGNVSALAQGVDFVRDVFRRAHDENGVRFKDYDVNGMGGAPDGIVDGAILVVNVPDVGITLPIEYLNSGSNLAGGSGGAFVLDGVQIPYVAIGGASFPGAQQHLEYVALHEFGHTLGMADLYYEHPSSGDKFPSWQGLHFSLMGDYAYGPEATLPDAETRRALGWQKRIVVSGAQTITLRPAGEGGAAVKLGMMSGSRREYFLAEVRGPANGVDTGIADASGNPTWGLSLTHVDWSIGPKAGLGEWTTRLVFCLDCDPFHPFVQNVESDGGFGLVDKGTSEGGVGRAAANGTPDDYVLWHGGAISSIPGAPALADSARYVATNYYDGTPSGIAIRDITVNDDHSVTATFVAPEVSDPCSDVVCPATEVCVRTGDSAGNCVAADPDPQPGPVKPPVAGAAGGCSSTGPSGAFAMLLGLACVVRARRRP